MQLVFTNKFCDTYWKLLGWIVYISLLATSVWFTWGVIEKFAKKETAIQQYEDKIEVHPTIVICPKVDYQYFNITYTTYKSDGISVEDEVILKMGENYQVNSEKIVNLTTIYTRWNKLCYAINTSRNVDEKETEIKIWSYTNSTYLQRILRLDAPVAFFTSEKNSYGVTNRDWRDGVPYSFDLSSQIRKEITLTVEKNTNMNCKEESFYEYVASKLSEESFQNCNDACLLMSLPNDPYPICPNYEPWAKNEPKCNWSILKYLIRNITNNDEHLKTCSTSQFFGHSQDSSGEEEVEIRYKFALPLKAKVYEEYLIIDWIGLIGSVGGTLGVFIGFSFSNLITCLIEYIKSQMERNLKSPQKITLTIWKCLEWIIYLSLMATAILFAREVIENFFGRNTGIKQNMEKIESHPTITICPRVNGCLVMKCKDGFPKSAFNLPLLAEYTIQDCIDAVQEQHPTANGVLIEKPCLEKCKCYAVFYMAGWDGASSKSNYQACMQVSSLCMMDSLNYGTEFNITYQTYKNNEITISEETIPLSIGENYLSVSEEKVSLTKIHTRWNDICYKLRTMRKVDFSKTEIKLKTSASKTFGTTELFFTSEENSYGVTNKKFMDGEAFLTKLNGGMWKEIYLSVEKNVNLACSKASFFEYVRSMLSKSNLENCTYTCLRTSLLKKHYPFCLNYEDWYDIKGNVTKPEEDCNLDIIKDLMEDTMTGAEHLKTCTTIEYSGNIMMEKNVTASNELGIQYKFAFPLRAKVYQEYLIIDTIDLVGSVGGMLGLFIGFSFSNIITCIMGYIGKFLASRNKLSQDIWSLIEWIIYLALVATSIWFTWGVLDKFFKQDTGIQQYQKNIEMHPTIVICGMGAWKYQTDFTIRYYWDRVDLVIGENYLKTKNATVSLTRIHTRYNGICYAINTTKKVDEQTTTIMILPSSSVDHVPGIIPVIFTSEMNSYGVTQRDWRDGEGFSFDTSIGSRQDIDLTVEKNVNLKCIDQSFYEYVASRFSDEEKFERCNETCLMTSLPNDPYPICPNYEEWYGNDTKGKEFNCNWHVIKDLIQNITVNEEHLKTCVTSQYLGEITLDKDYGADRQKYAIIKYKFSLPLKAKVYEEYLITDGITLIGSVGGTLGLFIGFSISNVVYSILDFLKSTTEIHFSRKSKKEGKLRG